MANKNMMEIIPVILCGGQGTRLWPLSRKQYPKQFLKLCSNKTMLQETLLRLKSVANLAEPIIVCNTEHRFLVAQQLLEIDCTKAVILVEPIGRNTAPAITLAALKADEKYQQSVLLVLPSDHNITNIPAFHQAINQAYMQAKQGKLITFGIKADHVNTGYGYIQADINKSISVYPIKKFVEKPDEDTAKRYVASGDYFFNSGMFVFHTKHLLALLKQYANPLLKQTKIALENSIADFDFIRIDESSFAQNPDISIDYAIMEKISDAVVVPLDVGWSDVGTWDSLTKISPKTQQDNTFIGDVFSQGTHNTYIYSQRLVATIDIEDLVVVDTVDALLISHKNSSHKVKNILQEIRDNGYQQTTNNRKVYRPWGWYDSIDNGDFFQVKRLHIKSGATLSLQRHQHRAEHWVVVNGTANVINGQKHFVLNQGQSTYIPLNTMHRLENKQNEVLEIIEVQSGLYLGEDDIERFADIYGRKNE